MKTKIILEWTFNSLAFTFHNLENNLNMQKKKLRNKINRIYNQSTATSEKKKNKENALHEII